MEVAVSFVKYSNVASFAKVCTRASPHASRFSSLHFVPLENPETASCTRIHFSEIRKGWNHTTRLAHFQKRILRTSPHLASIGLSYNMSSLARLIRVVTHQLVLWNLLRSPSKHSTSMSVTSGFMFDSVPRNKDPQPIVAAYKFGRCG